MKKPNILVLMTDHQRADTVLKKSRCITPNMDKFLDESINFTQTFCPTPHCCPARATFMSGLYPSRTGVWNNVSNDYAINRGPFKNVRMFSEDLHDAGYDLAYTGKWHVSALASQTPKAYGWRELVHYEETIQDGRAKWKKIREDAAKEESPRKKGEIQVSGYSPHYLYSCAEGDTKDDGETMRTGLNEIENLADSSKPWCLYIGLNAPHAPYDVDQKYLDMYDLNDIKLPESFYDTMEDKPDYYKKLRNISYDQFSTEETKDAIRHFLAYCTKIDMWFGQVLDALEKSGHKDDTLVMFCADHGDYVGDHGLFHKQVPAFLGAYKVPMVIRWPEGITNPGREVNEFISLADFAPTFLELAGIKTDRYFSGASIVPFFNNETPSNWRNEICTQLEGMEQMFTQRMVVSKKYKYVYNGFARDELYDLENDPHEMKNIFDVPAMKSVIKDLVSRMWEFAYKEQDKLGSTQYIMVNTAPHGPMQAFRNGKHISQAAQNPNLSNLSK